ncbi:hypothetical protein PI124_g22083 [Phytophthora idaei]|nr:hypothetical protein PI125_g23863 [Phytophthora idaei]KAG3232839.1 hypothetical protein PI124_g22083 [Phytophthora idaei]
MAEDEWEEVFFTDKAMVEMHGTTGRVFVWRRSHEAFAPSYVPATFKSSRKSVMVWSSNFGNGIGPLHICESDGCYYRKILVREVPFSKTLNGLPDWTLFVHDNAPARTAKNTKKLLLDLNLKVLTHPAQSPDLNPIENIWAILKWELNKTPASSLEDLKQKLSKIWYQIHDGIVIRAVRSTPQRPHAVKQAKGGQTKCWARS